jgi:CheY-like chemotaxis protein
MRSRSAGSSSTTRSGAARAGYQVLEAPDGRAALRLVEAARPCLILLDVQMPDLDGWGFLDAYHRLPGPHAPVVLVTGEAAPARVRGSAQQVDAILAKPFGPADLLEVVRRYA